MKTLWGLLAFVFLFSVFTACSSSAERRSKYQPDLGELSARVDIFRFEQDLMALSRDSTKIKEGIEKLKEKYPDFAPLYFGQIMGMPDQQPDFAPRLLSFLDFKESQLLYDSIQLAYPNLDQVQADLEQAGAHYLYYFGGKKHPFEKVYTYFSFYNYGTFTLEDYSGLGLDFFLGPDHIGYLAHPNLKNAYMRRTLTAEHISAKMAYALADRLVEQQAKRESSRLIDEMLFNGKKFFLAGAFLPQTADSLLFNFSAFQVEFCEKGEQGLWDYLGEQDLLYSSDATKYRKYVTVGPFKPELDLPGNSGSWLGAQILRQYAQRRRLELKNNRPNSSPQEIDQVIIQEILNESRPEHFMKRYKPRK
ncbi:hypothetical protein SapgrDRAFT_1842 [Saprospira grandis DSM 2844]|uniref:Gliding motility-associated lipoprotein GldB n=1 Tax=Saprospira grandis DSM 2844 TaxID=694433 RepID=J0P7N8_9BACT|nr:hypothetical protein [Saprospira grandis]EJF53537.1 hypothetical protein SapgrDRAFT_1842 [Saprospira grandis DSM 2844]